MSIAYLFLYDNTVGSRERVKGILESMPEVTTWRYDLPNCFYIISPYRANELHNSFVALSGTKGRFMFIEASDNRQGLMLPDTWYLLTNKAHKPKKRQ